MAVPKTWSLDWIPALNTMYTLKVKESMRGNNDTKQNGIMLQKENLFALFLYTEKNLNDALRSSFANHLRQFPLYCVHHLLFRQSAVILKPPQNQSRVALHCLDDYPHENCDQDEQKGHKDGAENQGLDFLVF